MISRNIVAILATVALVGTIGLSPVFADLDKTEYLTIQGTIPVENSKNYSNLTQITLVDAMTIAENKITDSKSMHAKLSAINGYLVYKVVMTNDNHEYSKVLVDAGNGDVLYVTNSKSFDTTIDEEFNNDEKMKDYFKEKTIEQITEKKKQFKEMTQAWKSLSISDKAAMIVHFKQIKVQLDILSDEQNDKQKTELKDKLKEYMTLSPEEKKQKLDEYVQSIKK